MKHLCITHLIPFQWEYPSLACSLLLFLTALLPSSTALAQVNWKDRPVTLAKFDQKNSSIARPARTDFTVVVWEDYREGTNLSDIYAQKIDNATGQPLWGPIDGVPVCTAVGDQRNPRAAYDTLGNVIVVWEDYRVASVVNGVWENVKIRVNALELGGGGAAPNYDASYDGFVVCGNPYGAGDPGPSGRDPRIVGTGEGAYITWTDYRSATHDAQSAKWTGRHIYEQYVLSERSPMFHWADNGIQVDQSSVDAINPEIVLDNMWDPFGNNPVIHQVGSVVVFQDCYNDSTNSYQLQGVRHDRDGTWMSGPTNVAPVTAPWSQQHHRLKETGGAPPDGICAGGIKVIGTVVVWEEHRDTPNTQSGIHIAIVDSNIIVNASADLEPNQEGLCQNPKVTVLDKPDPYAPYAIVAWEREDGAPNGLDVLANYTDLLSGTTYYQQPVDICGYVGDQYAIDLDITGTNQYPHVNIGWIDNRDGDADIYFQDVDLINFLAQKQASGWPVALANRDRISLDVGRDVFVFTDGRRDYIGFDTTADYNVYCQKPGEECDDPTTMRWRDIYARTEMNGRVSDYRGTSDSSGSQYLIWTAPVDWTDRQSTSGVFVQKLDKYGVPRWSNNGILLSNPDNPASRGDIAQDGTGGVYVVWQEYSGGSYLPYVARILASGEFQWMDQYCVGSPVDVWPRVAPIEYRYASGSPSMDRFLGCYVSCYESANDRMFLTQYDDDGLEGMFQRPTVSGYSMPVMQTDNIGGVFIAYLATNDVGIIHWDGTIGVANGFLGAIPTRNYDFCVDLLVNRGEMRIAYVSNGSEFTSGDLCIKHCDPSLAVLAKGVIRSQSISSTYSHPAIAADSTGVGSELGDTFVAWNEEYLSSGMPYHRVRVNATIENGTVVFPRWNADSVFGGLNSRMTQPTIAIHSNNTPLNWQNIHRLCSVAWRDDNILTCANDSAIRVIQFDYDGNLLLDANGNPANPGLLSLGKSQPMLLHTNGTSVALFWLDSLGSGLNLMGTQLHAESNEVIWDKRRDSQEQEAAIPSTLELNIRPQPYEPDVHGDAIVSFSLPANGNVRCVLFDALGREVTTVYEGFATMGHHTVGLQLRRSPQKLSSGLYLLQLNSGACTESRRVLISF